MLGHVLATVEALRTLGRLEATDEALIGLALTLAQAMDDELAERGSRFTVSALSGRLLPVLVELRGTQADGTATDDELERLVRTLRDPERP